MKITLNLPRQLRWPITWGTAVGSLGLALLAGSATTNSTAGPPGRIGPIRPVSATSADAALAALDDDDDDDVDEDEAPSGKVRIGGQAAGGYELPSANMEMPAASAPYQNYSQNYRPARPSVSFWSRKPRAPKASAVRFAPRSRPETPFDQRPANSIPAARPVTAESLAAAAAASDSAMIRVHSQQLPGQELTGQSLTGQPLTAAPLSEQAPAAGDEAELREILSDNTAPPLMPAEPQETAAEDVDAQMAELAEDPAFISLRDAPTYVAQSSAGDCPPTEGNIDALVDRIHADDAYDLTNRKPIGKLRADMRMRLPNRHSILWNLREKPDEDTAEAQRLATRDRVARHEKVRCDIEEERQAIRADYKAMYPYDDRGAGTGCDADLAPLFPFTYNPLYFEDPNLERCGHSFGCAQPFASMIHFYGNVALFPVKALIICPWECVYPQPDCAPCTRYSCLDNLAGPCPETIGWGCFKSRRYSCRNCQGSSW